MGKSSSLLTLSVLSMQGNISVKEKGEGEQEWAVEEGRPLSRVVPSIWNIYTYVCKGAR